jgi:hypothetical protein
MSANVVGCNLIQLSVTVMNWKHCKHLQELSHDTVV